MMQKEIFLKKNPSHVNLNTLHNFITTSVQLPIMMKQALVSQGNFSTHQGNIRMTKQDFKLIGFSEVNNYSSVEHSR